MTTKLFALAAALVAGAAFAAGPGPGADPLAGDGNPFSDPVFQDFVETSSGYLNSRNTGELRGDFRSDYRDAPISPALPTLKTPTPTGDLCEPAPVLPRPDAPGAPLSHYPVTFSGSRGPLGSNVRPLGATDSYARDYVFLSVIPSGSDKGLVQKLEACADFRFAGEKTIHSSRGKRTAVLGWAPFSSLDKIIGLKGVASAGVEKRSSGMPFKTRVVITLKVPLQNKPGAFVPEYIKTLGARHEFAAENWFRLPDRSASSRFTLFTVNGTLPLDMVGEVSRSPFVTAVEFRDTL